MRKIAFISLLLLIFSATALFAQQKGYKVAENEISTKLPAISKKNENIFKVSISRKFSGKKEESLLKIAEVVYPTAAEKAGNCSDSTAGKSSGAPDWACGSFDDVLLPYSVTKSAVVYYLKLTDGFRKGGSKMKNSMLNYSAEIKFQPNFQINGNKFTNVYAVSLKLVWTQVCGELCALNFSKERIVVLDEKGSVLSVSGDGETPALVS